MAATPSVMIPLGTAAPEFTLVDSVSGRTMSLGELKSEVATVVMFICNHCPYVVHVREGLIALARDYAPRGVSFIAVSSNDAVAYPDDGPERMREEAMKYGYPFPYLFDERQEVARAYQAACTPDIYVFDASLHLIYRGQLDASRPGNGVPVTGADVRGALDAAIAGTPVNPDQRPSIGCNIKWKK
ncbi:MAG TPA: thioredoxin family protein [Candidatus Kapabacteria bacterium]|nr:thioredoxin family protein [Candidatus Kapabacteria bacterium]